MLGKIQPRVLPAAVRAGRGPAARSRRGGARSSRRSPTRSALATGTRARRPKRWPRASCAWRSANMANAIKFISVQRGYDVTAYTLAASAAPAASTPVWSPRSWASRRCSSIRSRACSRRSAWASRTSRRCASWRSSDRSPRQRCTTSRLEIDRLAADGATRGRAPGRRPRARSRSIRRVHLKYAGTDTSLVVHVGRARGHARGLRDGLPHALCVPDARPSARDRGAVGRGDWQGGADGGGVRAGAPSALASPLPRVRMFAAGSFQEAPVFYRETLSRGQRIDGPAIIAETNTTAVVEPGWRAEVTAQNHLVLQRYRRAQSGHAIGTTADPVMLEVFNNLFMSIAEQMGVRLRNTAHSVNIKERLDFSCALFDGDGGLVANAPHMPVHLGAMGEIVGRRARTPAGSQPGDVVRAQRSVRRRHAPARHHRGDAGVRRRTPRRVQLLRRRARATTPTSAASRPAPCRRSRAPSTRRA